MTYRRIRIARLGKNQTVAFAVRELVKYLKQMDWNWLRTDRRMPPRMFSTKYTTLSEEMK